MNTEIKSTSSAGRKLAIARCLLALMLVQVFEPVALAYNDSSTLFRFSEKTEMKPAKNAVLKGTNVEASEQLVKSREFYMNCSALTGGPGGQTEASGFSLNTNSDLVDPFTGDFSYSIPLMDVEGYPITLSYNSNVGMMDEASWVGLGWNLNVGSVSREKRGIPDEFDGSQSITSEHNQKPDENTNGSKLGLTAGLMYRGLIGSRKSALGLGLDASILGGYYTNTYTGYSRTLDLNVGVTLEMPFGSTDNQNADGTKVPYFLPLKFGLGYSSDSKNGIGRSTSMGFSDRYLPSDKHDSPVYGFSYGSNYSTRSGVTNRGISMQNNVLFGRPVGVGVLGANFNCGTSTYVPRVSTSTRTEYHSTIIDFTKAYKITSASKWGWNYGVELQLHHSDQEMDFVTSSPAFGYFYSAKGASYPRTSPVTMDFNREREGEFSEEMKYLPYAFPTYDIFYVNGAGMGGTFRGQRNDVGVYKDAAVVSTNGSLTNAFNVGKEFSSEGQSLILGYTNTNGSGWTESGEWVEGNEFFQFGPDSKVTFKGIGEPTPKESNLYELLGDSDPSALILDKTETPPAILATDQLVTQNIGGGAPITTLSTSLIDAENKPDKRATIYRPLKASEITTPAYPAISLYNLNDFDNSNTSGTFSRIETDHLASHISGVEVISTSGMKYFYGLPVYSKNESEIGFATNTTTGDSEGLFTYTSNPTENSTSNTSGTSGYYDKTTTPAYASAFLLTHLFSDDYTDISGNGPSLDDPGNYYKFNYTKLYGGTTPYKWRMPYGADQAYFNENMLSIDSDNMGMYSYGEKEIWYTHSVESKNMIAEFTLGDRKDAHGVAGINGGMAPSAGLKLKKLEKITLYNKSERVADGSTAKAIMTIEFKYDYSLCKENPSNENGTGTDSGKLTLLEIRVYSGPTSQETALAPIVFTYSANNPDFSYKAADRWGAYKPNDDPARPLEIYPYAEQDQTDADINCKAWKLTKIESPGGSSLEIDYAADHYAFVQNKRAMRHMDMKGFMTQFELNYLLGQSTWDETSYITNDFHKSLSNSTVEGLMGLTSLQLAGLILKAGSLFASTGALTDVGYYAQLDKTPTDVVIFELDEPLSGGSKPEVEKEFRDKYLKRDDVSADGEGYIEEVYFRSMVEVKSGAEAEMIPTFASIKRNDSGNLGTYPLTGLLPEVGGAYKYGYIVLQSVNSTEERMVEMPWIDDPILMHPLEKAAMEFSRLNLSELVYMNAYGQSGDLSVDHAAFWSGDVYSAMQEKNLCTKIVTDYPSQLRLCDPDNIKYGGGAYVKSITISDNWDVISGEYKSSYATYWQRMNNEARPSSYGVAAYEPSIGADENALYAWSRYKNRAVAYPDQSKFTVVPIGSSLYPSPVVGYSTIRVEIRGFQHDKEENELYQTVPQRDGYSIMKFYTAYDHPTISRSTKLEKLKANNLSLTIDDVDLFGFTQGHALVTNDFHGQPKRFETYDQFGTLQSSTTYNYRKPGEKIKMLDKTGALTDERVAMEYDIMVDSRFVSSVYISRTLGLSMPFKLPTFTPSFPIPIIGYSSREVGYYSHVIDKHINYSAILESVITETMSSVATAENIVRDRETGQVILSALNDEFDDKLYSFSYPAHWYYTLFRSPLEQLTTASGTMSGNELTASTHLVDKLTVGDEVLISYGVSSTMSALVLRVEGTKAYFITSTGALITGVSGSCTIAVTKSGRKNILSGSMQSVVTKRNPISGSTFTFPAADIIEAGAVTFRPRLNVLCHEIAWESGVTNALVPGDRVNPFRYGVLNNLIVEHSYSPQLELNISAVQGSRFNSVYQNYFSFYKLNTSGYWSQIDEALHPNTDPTDLKRWRPSGEITVTDEIGKTIESKDQINVSSAVLYGYNKYNKLVPVAQVVNAKQNEIAYESFDDHTYMSGSDFAVMRGHFNFVSAIAADPTRLSLSSTYRHSGVKSLLINGVGSASVTREVISTEECSDPLNSFSENSFKVEECNCIKPFEPYQGKKYMVSLWIKGNRTNTDRNYNTVFVEISYTGSGTVETFFPTGQMIDGWQRVEGVFTIPATATEIIVKLENTYNSTAYFDDLRIHPYRAAMTTTVYDPETLLPMASHDGNNYTTFYGYDENLSPVRVRVETINGIQTITESESGTVMKFKN